MEPHTEHWMTTEEAASYLGLSRRALYQAIARRELPFFKLGKRRVRFKKQDLDLHIEQSRVPSLGEE